MAYSRPSGFSSRLDARGFETADAVRLRMVALGVKDTFGAKTSLRGGTQNANTKDDCLLRASRRTRLREEAKEIAFSVDERLLIGVGSRQICITSGRLIRRGSIPLYDKKRLVGKGSTRKTEPSEAVGKPSVAMGKQEITQTNKLLPLPVDICKEFPGFVEQVYMDLKLLGDGPCYRPRPHESEQSLSSGACKVKQLYKSTTNFRVVQAHKMKGTRPHNESNKRFITKGHKGLFLSTFQKGGHSTASWYSRSKSARQRKQRSRAPKSMALKMKPPKSISTAWE
jgi:hypothetical protein